MLHRGAYLAVGSVLRIVNAIDSDVKKSLTPQQKKKHSLAKDCRNRYGENDKSSRKNVRRSRAFQHRKYRHNVQQAIVNALANDVEGAEGVDDAVSVVRRGNWEKAGDTPLGQVIADKMERRKRTGQTGV